MHGRESICIVLDAEYHGWYVHGDAAYEHADDTMAQLSNHLLEDPGEQARLVPDMPEAHVFQLWLSPAFRRAWRNVQDRVMDKTLELPDPEADVAAREATRRIASRDSRTSRPATEADERRRQRAAALHAAKRIQGERGTAAFGPGAAWSTECAVWRHGPPGEGSTDPGRVQSGSVRADLLPARLRGVPWLDWQAARPDTLDRIMGKGPPPTADGSVILQPDKGWFFGEGDLQFTQCLFWATTGSCSCKKY